MTDARLWLAKIPSASGSDRRYLVLGRVEYPDADAPPGKDPACTPAIIRTMAAEKYHYTANAVIGFDYWRDSYNVTHCGGTAVEFIPDAPPAPAPTASRSGWWGVSVPLK